MSALSRLGQALANSERDSIIHCHRRVLMR
jgi:hypothetical protein